MEVLDMWLRVLVLFLLRLQASEGFPALIRAKPKSHSLLRSSGLERFRLPKFHNFHSSNRHLQHPLQSALRQLFIIGEEDEVEDTKAEMAALLADEQSDVANMILSYDGDAVMKSPLKVVFEVYGRTHVADLQKFDDVIDEVTLLPQTRQIIVRIKAIGRERWRDVQNVFPIFERIESIFIVEADCKLHPRVTTHGGPPMVSPTDRLHVDYQWPHINHHWPPIHLNLRRAWKVIEERNLQTNDVILGVADNGVDVFHEDLKDSFWTNDAETRDGQDTDGNMCIDDLHGCNFESDVNLPHGYFAARDHGTHIAGIIAAATNNGIGIAGCSERNNIKLLFGQVQYVSQVTKALDYFYSKNITISSHSYGYDRPIPTVEAAINRGLHYDHLFFWAVNNGGGGNLSDPFTSGYNDWPPRYFLPSVVNVANAGQNGRVFYSSNFGNEHVHIAAPGDWIVSTYTQNRYGYMSGTSMATPYVAGVAGLVKTSFPELSSPQLKRILLQSYRKLPHWNDKLIHPGIPDATRAIQFALCERAFLSASHSCTALPTSSEIHFWRNAGDAATLLATKCQSYCRIQSCINNALQDLSCSPHFCRALEGACEDVRVMEAAKLGSELPSYKCPACTLREVYSGVVEFNIASKVQDPKEIAKMAESLGQVLLSSLPIYEAVLDVWESGDDKLSIVYRLSSTTSNDVMTELTRQLGNPANQTGLRNSTFFDTYCENPQQNCSLHWHSEL